MNEPDQPLPCWVYRSSRHEEMYLYLRVEDDFETVPRPLLERFGAPRLVLQLDLHAARPLAREDVIRVMSNLRRQGFHLQMPPQLQPELFEGD